MAAAFSTVVKQPLSASPTVNFSRIRIPPANFRLRDTIMVNSYLRTCTMAMATSGDNSVNSPEVADVPPKLQERDFMGTPYVPVYVMLPMGIIDMECEIVDADGLLNQLKTLKAANIDGVTIECWWGIVEAHAPHKYNWNGYKMLFKIIREFKLKIRVVMSFHECEGSVGDDVYIPLPRWVTEIGDKNPDIYFTDKDLRRNHECLTWGIDKERVLRGRTALEVYFDLMRNFRIVFDEFLEYRIISHIEVGLGPRGELRYPSHSAKFGWKYPGIGEFQCYDKYLYKSLQKAAEAWGTSLFGKGPENTGSFNSKPQNTQFFRDGGEYNSFYGTFFLDWYFQVLIDHADRVLGLADLAFKGTPIAAKLPGIHWWRNTNSHAAELTAGFHHRCYSRIASTLKKHESTLNFACLELGTRDEEKEFLKALADPKRPVWEKEFLEASADPYRLVLEVLNAAWVAYIPAAGENARPIYHREGYNRILENAKPLGDPSCRRRLSVFTYLRLGPTLLEKHNLMEFGRFVQKMHGEVLTPINLKY